MLSCNTDFARQHQRSANVSLAGSNSDDQGRKKEALHSGRVNSRHRSRASIGGQAGIIFVAQLVIHTPRYVPKVRPFGFIFELVQPLVKQLAPDDAAVEARPVNVRRRTALVQGVECFVGVDG